MFTIEVTQRAIFCVTFQDTSTFSAELYVVIKSEIIDRTVGVLKESQSAVKVSLCVFSRVYKRV